MSYTNYVILGLATILCLHAATPAQTIMEMGTLPRSGNITVKSLSGDGRVVLLQDQWYPNGFGGQSVPRALIWSLEQGYQVLPTPIDHHNVAVHGISYDGSIVVGRSQVGSELVGTYWHIDGANVEVSTIDTAGLTMFASTNEGVYGGTVARFLGCNGAICDRALFAAAGSIPANPSPLEGGTAAIVTSIGVSQNTRYHTFIHDLFMPREALFSSLDGNSLVGDGWLVAIVSGEYRTGLSRGFVYQAGTLRLISPTQAGFWNVRTTGVDANGTIVVGLQSQNTAFPPSPIGLKYSIATQEVTELSYSTGTAWPVATSNEGTRIVGMASNGHPVLWDGNTAGMHMVEFLAAQRVNLAGFGPPINRVDAISADGLVIAGTSLTNQPFALNRPWIVHLRCSDGNRLDLSQDGTIDVADIFVYLAAWFSSNGDCNGPPAECIADRDASGTVTVTDIFQFLSDWFHAGAGASCD